MNRFLSSVAFAFAFAFALPLFSISPAIANDWTGFYLGANGGLAGGSNDEAELRSTATGAIVDSDGDLKLSGEFFGLQGGYNWQHNEFVFGVETDFQFDNRHDESNALLGQSNGIIDVDWWSTARGRIGYDFQNVMIYATAGLAMTNLSSSQDEVVASFDGNRFGLAAGAGIEIALNENISMKAEYLFVGTGENRVTDSTGTNFYLEDQSFHVGRIGINFHF